MIKIEITIMEKHGLFTEFWQKFRALRFGKHRTDEIVHAPLEKLFIEKGAPTKVVFLESQ